MDIYVAVWDSLHTVISYKHIMLLVIILLLTYLAAQLVPKKKTYYSLNDIKQTCPLCGMLGLMRSFSHTTCKINICFRFEADNNEQAGTGENGERCCFSVVVFGTKRASLC